MQMEEEWRAKLDEKIYLKGASEEKRTRLRKRCAEMFDELALVHVHVRNVANHLARIADDAPSDEAYIHILESAA